MSIRRHNSNDVIKVDYIGRKYGTLTVVGFAGRANDGHAKWDCVCECGNHVVVQSNNLPSRKDCGAKLHKDKELRDRLVGKQFGKLTVVDIIPPPYRSHTICICRCECGKERAVDVCSLNNGKILTCGCDKKKPKQKAPAKKKRDKPLCFHGDAKHGEMARIYSIYHDMIRRCENPNNKSYSRYGGRGVTVCKEWKDSYLVFKEWAMSHGYSDDLSIDRIDPNGDYCPENCRWVDKFVQANNRRNNHYIVVRGESLTLMEASRKYGTPYRLIQSRVKRGWDAEDAVFLPKIESCVRSGYVRKDSVPKP